ncbi:MAG: hypothetical protein HY602_02665, partial [Parcubacteria group bacterium]|nr:hypothetical protein [Parcubacteria group bacterium]
MYSGLFKDTRHKIFSSLLLISPMFINGILLTFSRADTRLAGDPWNNFKNNFVWVWQRIFDLHFGSLAWDFNINGLIFGWYYLLSQPWLLILFILAVFLALIGIYLFYRQRPQILMNSKALLKLFLLGSALFITGFLPRLLSSERWVSLRETYFSSIGLAIIGGVLIFSICQSLTLRKAQTIFVYPMMLLIYTASSALILLNEQYQYSEKYQAEQIISSNIKKVLPEVKNEDLIILYQFPIVTMNQNLIYDLHTVNAFNLDYVPIIPMLYNNPTIKTYATRSMEPNFLIPKKMCEKTHILQYYSLYQVRRLPTNSYCKDEIKKAE